MPSVLDAIGGRRSHSSVTAAAPTHEQLLPLVAAAARMADHGALRPWRLIELRGEARRHLGDAFVAASVFGAGDEAGAAKLAKKPLRAALLIAVVASRKDSEKVEAWEQDVAAAGVGHALSLLLGAEGWGVMWRTGSLTRSLPVRRMHDLGDSEELLGWLYVGGVPDDAKPAVRAPIDPAEYITVIDR